MILTPKDLTSFLFCPFYYQKYKSDNKFGRKLVLSENCLKQAILKSEGWKIIYNRPIGLNKPKRFLEEIWWEKVAQLNIINTEKATSTAKNLNNKITQYFKEDLFSESYLSVGTELTKTISIGLSEIESKIDIVKYDSLAKTESLVLIEFNTREFKDNESSLDILTKIKCFPWFRNRGENIIFFNINIDRDIKDIKVTRSIYRPEDFLDIKNMIQLSEYGIRNNIKYKNTFNCKGCRLCMNLN